jgi:hypothetical protein
MQAPDEIEDEICSEEHLAKRQVFLPKLSFLAKVEFLANYLS